VLSDDIQVHAICLFFHDYILGFCPGLCEGWLDYLPDLYERHSENSGLQYAVLAVAYANIGQRTARKDLELKATLFYRASLETVKNNISNPRLATSDINMTAVILLGLYEVSTFLLQLDAKTYDLKMTVYQQFHVFRFFFPTYERTERSSRLERILAASRQRPDLTAYRLLPSGMFYHSVASIN